MSDAKLVQIIDEQEQRWQTLNSTIRALRFDLDTETRSEERLRIQQKIETKQTDQTAIEEELAKLQAQSDLVKLREKLLNEERNGSYSEAIETAEKIRSLYPEEKRIEQKIGKLRERQAFYQPALEALGNIGIHIASLGMPFYEKLASALHPKNKRDDLITLLPPTQQFLF